MKQYVGTYLFRHNMGEISKNISDMLAANPDYSVQTISTIVYDGPTGKYVDAIVVYNIDQTRAFVGLPGDVYDNGYRLPVNNDPIPCAKGVE